MSTIHYQDHGRGFPIVWLHGFPLSSGMFAPQLSIEGFRHVRPDLRGFGRTPPSHEPTSMESYARDVLEVLDHARVERTVLAGFSMGGYVAMELLRRAPDRFVTVLLLDTRETPDTEEGRAARRRQADDVAAHGTKNLIESMLPRMAIGERVRGEVETIMTTASPRGVIDALGAMAARPDSTMTLRSLRIPALVVVGDRDEITPPADAERMSSIIPHAELAPIAQAAHMANFERPQQLNPLIAAFLMRHVLRPDHAESL